MNESKRKKLSLLIIILCVILMIGVIYLTLVDNPLVRDRVQENENNVPANLEAIKAQAEQQILKKTYEYRPDLEANRQMDKEDLERMAFAFAERFGSYSNESNYGNISDLQIFMTDNMKEWSEGLIRELKAEEYSGEYYGITTKALTSETLDYGANTASFLINTQRREVEGQVAKPAYQLGIVINFVKEDGDWKVSSANWQ